jgi:hypothetical protein
LATHSSAGCSSSARPVPLVSPLVVPPATCDESGGLHCDHCGCDGHVEAFCYWKKKAQKAQAHRSSYGTGGTSFRGSDRSYICSEIQEILMLLHHLAASTSLGATGSVTLSSASTCSATASQSFALGSPSTPSPGTDPWYLDSDASFHMTPHSTHLSALHLSYHHCIVHTTDDSPLSVAVQGMLCSDSFSCP